MSNIHVGHIQKDETGRSCTIRVFYHLPVPTNYQGTDFNLVARLVEALGAGEAQAPGTDGAEATQITNREVYEVEETMNVNLEADPNLVGAVARAEARWTELSTAQIDRLHDEYEFWSYAWDLGA